MQPNESDDEISRTEIQNIKNKVKSLVQKRLKAKTATDRDGELFNIAELLKTKLNEKHRFETVQGELDQLAALIEIVRQIFLVNNISDEELQIYKNQAANLQYYVQEMRVYDKPSASAVPKPVSESTLGLTPEQKSKIKHISVVYVNGSRFNPFGHAALFLGKELGYAHIQPSDSFPYFRGYPRLMSVEEFNTYLRNQNKQIIAVQQIKFPKGNLVKAVEKLDELLQKKWTWMGIQRNCLSFCKKILKAGGHDCAELGDKKSLEQNAVEYNVLKKTGGLPLPLRRLKDVNPAQLNHKLAAGLKPIQAEQVIKVTSKPGHTHRPNMRQVYSSIKKTMEPVESKKWRQRIDWAFVWNFYSGVFNSKLLPDDVLTHSKVIIIKRLRDFEFKVLESNFIKDRLLSDPDMKHTFNDLKEIGYTASQITAVLKLKHYINNRGGGGYLDSVGKNNIQIAEQSIEQILMNPLKSVAEALNNLSIEEIKKSQGILARNDINPSTLVGLLMELKKETAPGAYIDFPMLSY